MDMGKKSRDNPLASFLNIESPKAADEASNDSTLENQPSESESHTETNRNSDSLLEDSTNLQHRDSPQKEKSKPKHGFLLWYDQNKDMLEEENPEMGTSELTKIGMKMFKQLSAEEKKVRKEVYNYSMLNQIKLQF